MDTRYGIHPGTDGSTERVDEREAHDRDDDLIVSDDRQLTMLPPLLQLPDEVDVADALDQLRSIDDPGFEPEVDSAFGAGAHPERSA